MATLVWDQIGDRSYETGVSKCVLYHQEGVGVAWNGITSIEENIDASVEPIYFDGVKFQDIVTVGDFAATIRAFTYPEEFLEHQGTFEDQEGFFILNQPPIKFGLSYQTNVGDDVAGPEAGYKIHILYGLTAIPGQTSRQSIGEDIEPIDFEWTVTSVPEEIENFRPTAHVIFDSRKFNEQMFKDIEAILYGDEENDAYLPPLKALSTFVRKWARLIITDNGDGTWTAESEEVGVITMLDATTFQIISDTAVFIDAISYNISSSEKEDDDIWLP